MKWHMHFPTSIHKTRARLLEWAETGTYECHAINWYYAYLAQKFIHGSSHPATGIYKERWTPEETERSDHRHYMYIDDEILDHAASQLGLKPCQHVLDIDSAFGHTGRYLHQKYGTIVTRVRPGDSARIYHTISSCIDLHTGFTSRAYSSPEDFFELLWGQGNFDSVISLMTLF